MTRRLKAGVRELVGVHLDSWSRDGVVHSAYRIQQRGRPLVAVVSQEAGSSTKRVAYFKVSADEISHQPSDRGVFR